MYSILTEKSHHFLTCPYRYGHGHAELDCTARLTEVTGSTQAVALVRPSVVWPG